MVGGDFSTPIVHQDLINSGMPTIYMPFGGVLGGYNTSYLGGVQMPRQLDQDKVDLMNNKEKEDKGTFKKALLALGTILALGSIPVLRKSVKKAGGISNYLKNKWSNVINSIKGNKQTSKCSFWQKLKNVFKSKKVKP